MKDNVINLADRRNAKIVRRRTKKSTIKRTAKEKMEVPANNLPKVTAFTGKEGDTMNKNI